MVKFFGFISLGFYLSVVNGFYAEIIKNQKYHILEDYTWQGSMLSLAHSAKLGFSNS